ncbi:hypothetical protein CVT26_004577 [Gymnopilus dilepis]|uniref:Cytochrome P450 n=1 Tax=Gymnopilus dilepis TaxID=231916 RepID=A0A409YU47_9AGAR|nr:hypothetical protein CVT26_004577 [Gymnopilus dilepis]
MSFDSSTFLPTVLILLIAYLTSKWINSPGRKLKHIPTVGSSGILGPYIDAFNFFFHGHELIQEGYNKYYGTAFKVSTISKWLVIVSGEEMVDDIRRASEDTLSFEEAVRETVQADYTLGREVQQDAYHISIIRNTLTKNIGARFPEIMDEIMSSFGDVIPATDDWITVPAFTSIMKIVCRTTNRLFVGLPLCRNPDFRELNEQFTIDVMLGAQIINLFPEFLKPLAGRVLTSVPARIKRAVNHMRPLVEEQVEQRKKYGDDWPDKPNSLISWLFDEAKGPHLHKVEEIAIRVLSVNVAAIHTTTNALVHTIYNLAAYPEYVKPLREEAEFIIESEGWSKLSMQKLVKLESFISESQRSAVNAHALNRKVLKDFTFSNGITLPAGTEVAVASHSIHLDNKNYDHARQFQGFRFLDAQNDGEGLKHQFISLTPSYQTFGMGRHACPGRFFASNELKAMLAYILINYDVKFPNDGPRPADFWISGLLTANRSAEVMFRKRK